MRLKRTRLKQDTDKKFRPTMTTEVKEAQWGPNSEQEAHDRAVRAKIVVPEQVALQPIREAWWRRLVDGITKSWRA